MLFGSKSNEKKIFPYETFFKIGGSYCTEEDWTNLMSIIGHSI